MSVEVKLREADPYFGIRVPSKIQNSKLPKVDSGS